MMTLVIDLEVAIDLQSDLGEGPIWDAAAQRLIFVDSTAGLIHAFCPKTKEATKIVVTPQIGAAIPRRHGGYAVSATEGVLSVKPTGACALLAPIERDLPHHRMNDAKCDSRGRMLSGTFSLKFARGAGALYRIDPDLTVTCLKTGVSVSNGIGWSPDEKTLYFVDTSTRGIDAFDYDLETGSISNQRRFVELDRSAGLPDGLTVDADGYVWLALYLGGAVRRYAPNGTLVNTLELPVSGVTSCNFGGPDLADLYITTARYGVPAAQLEGEPLAGALFRCRPGVSGLPSHKFAG